MRQTFAPHFKAALAIVPLLLLSTAPGSRAANRIKVVASINDLASIASTVGGDQVDVTSVSKPTADSHRVEVLPSYMVKVARARLYLKVGLGLDQWADQIVDGSHNSNLLVVDCSKGVAVLEKPSGPVDASMGDVHPDGNPHYWLDPRNGAVVARTLADALAKVDPAHAADYTARAEAFAKEAMALAERGKTVTGALPTNGIITYHRSWSYFANAFGLDVLTTIEPIPGIPPTGKHLQEVVDLIKQKKPVVIFQEPFFSQDAGQFLARETGIRVESESASCDNVTAGSYLAHFEALLGKLSASAASPVSGR